MISFNSTTIEALESLCTSVPEWRGRLDELNGQIALRQIELARLTDDRPPTRSMKNKSSTESLRPGDLDCDPFEDGDQRDGIPMNPFDTPKSKNKFSTPAQRPSSSTPARAAEAIMSPPHKLDSIPRPSPGALTRQSSHPTPPGQVRIGPAKLRKRKTESLASGESLAPKYRTRSMIIVYYDDTVQTTFEELVKFVSASRNSMRKGKMAAKMAQMRRAAELEVENEIEDENDSQSIDFAPRNGRGAYTNVPASKARNGFALTRDTGAADLEADLDIPKLRFVSTRQMGPSRDVRNDNLGSTLSAGILRDYGRKSEAGDIFDTIDKRLEWCQSRCEHAAHQFLRDGECSTEIEDIKSKLTEVKEAAEKEIEKLKTEEDALSAGALPKRNQAAQGKSRELKSVQVRKEVGTTKGLEVDDMEVDDEGVEDLEPPELIFKRAGDVGR
jgi:hypothetical protein